MGLAASIVSLSVLVLTAVPCAGAGGLLQVDMEGVISQVPPDPALQMQFITGQTTSLSYVYDPTVMDFDPSMTRGGYLAIISLDGSFDGYGFTATGGTISVELSSNNRDVLQVTAVPPDISGAPIGSFALTGIFSNLEDTTETAFADDSLPTNLDLTDFSFNDMRLRFDDGNTSAFVYATVTSLTLPEPDPAVGSAAAVFAIGVLALLRRWNSGG
jgi:hypothetical protein